ncbi:MAG: response regulator [Bacteroidetes bacterium]|nr:response regulator [Bacteroidota bacterium]
MEKLNIFIVEDESIVSKDIQNSLIKLGYSVVGVANNGIEAIDKITALAPDLVLMDIMIKGTMTGIEVSEKLKGKINVPVVFLTAYADQDTLEKAKITEPYGYILKPFKEVELHTAIEMAVYKHRRDAELQKERDFLYSLVEGGKDDKEKTNGILFVKSNSKLVKVLLEDIYYVEALKDYVIINTQNTRYVVHSTMKDIEKKLGSSEFARVHRSFIARLDKIQSIDTQNVILEHEKKTIPIGGSYREELMRKLNML